MSEANYHATSGRYHATNIAGCQINECEKVTTMMGMFRYTSSILNLDLSNFNMIKVTNATDMLCFGSSNNLSTLKTPYNNAMAILITTSKTLYDASGNVTTRVLANLSQSVVISDSPSSSFLGYYGLTSGNTTNNVYFEESKKKYQYKIVKVKG